MFALGLFAVLTAVAIPQATLTIDRSRAAAGTRYLAARMALARATAVSRSATVGLRFEEEPDGTSFTAYLDGNHNGIRTDDIVERLDRPLNDTVRLWQLFPGVTIGVTPESGEKDAVAIGTSHILSFTPSGTATPGTVYVRGRDGSQLAVRVLGATGRTRMLRFDTRLGTWTDEE